MFDRIINEHRDGEDGSIPPRSSRFFMQNDDWYFTTREGAILGPFETQFEAKVALKDFLEFIRLAPPATLVCFTRAMTREVNSAVY